MIFLLENKVKKKGVSSLSLVKNYNLLLSAESLSLNFRNKSNEFKECGEKVETAS